MNKIVAAWCCLMLAAAPSVIMAQGKSPDRKAAPPTAKELDQQKQAKSKNAMLCRKKANDSKLKHGTSEYGKFMGQCLNQKS